MATTSKNATAVQNVRGYGKFDTKSMEFTFKPSEKGEPVQKNVIRRGRSKLYETEGEKESSVVAHIVASKNSTDPIADIYDDLGKLAKRHGTKIPPVPSGRKLLETPMMTVVADEEEKAVTAVVRFSYKEALMPSQTIVTTTHKLNTCLLENARLFI